MQPFDVSLSFLLFCLRLLLSFILYVRFCFTHIRQTHTRVHGRFAIVAVCSVFTRFNCFSVFLISIYDIATQPKLLCKRTHERPTERTIFFFFFFNQWAYTHTPHVYPKWYCVCVRRMCPMNDFYRRNFTIESAHGFFPLNIILCCRIFLLLLFVYFHWTDIAAAAAAAAVAVA